MRGLVSTKSVIELAQQKGITELQTFDSARHYLKVARIDHWFKNIFLLAGFFLAIAQNTYPLSFGLFLRGAVAFLLACLLSSSNYVINEIYDAQFDRKHPNKKFRSVAAGMISVKKLIYFNLFLIVFTLTASYFIFSWQFTLMMALFLIIGGVFYNIPPFRTKDLPVIDILGESVNNPIRLLLGWLAVVNTFELPLVAILGYWCFGAILVTAKRLAEFRHFGPELTMYRPTFKYYSGSLLVTLFTLFNVLTLVSLIWLSVTFNSRLFFITPFVVVLLVWFAVLTFQKNSIVKEPERIVEKKAFFAYCVLSLFAFAFLMLL